MTSFALCLPTGPSSSSSPSFYSSLIPKTFATRGSSSSSSRSLTFPIHNHGRHILIGGFLRCSPSSSSTPSSAATSPGGLSSAETFELTAQNVDLVLEEVRPYLVADGGNVEVVGVEDGGVISLRLQGACGTCPSSTTTMKMGIERVLKEKFGKAIKEIRQVYDQAGDQTSVEAVDRHLDILRPAISNYGGSVEVLSIDSGDCHVKYVGPESIGNGIEAAIKEMFPDIENVVFTG